MKLVLWATAAAVLLAAGPALADDKPAPKKSHHASYVRHHKGTRVAGFVQRRGGYSFVGADVINTEGDSRSIFGASASYKDPFADRQSVSGPFDHGFFYDSGIGPHGGDSPYPN